MDNYVKYKLIDLFAFAVTNTMFLLCLLLLILHAQLPSNSEKYRLGMRDKGRF